jgi:hypothetical protein
MEKKDDYYSVMCNQGGTNHKVGGEPESRKVDNRKKQSKPNAHLFVAIRGPGLTIPGVVEAGN